jgi:hypothetical protein
MELLKKEKFKQNKVSYKEMMHHKKLSTYDENQCTCNAETIEECSCGKFKK